MSVRLFLFFLLISTWGQSQVVDSSRIEFFKEIVYTLADDSMHGRATGSVEETKSLEFISEIVKRETNKKLKTHRFTIEFEDSIEVASKNGYLFVNNHAKETILIGAHYDHIGLGGKLSLSLKNDEVHNGADDNASGVALALGLLSDLKKVKSDKNYLFVFYSAHEIGLYGSLAFDAFSRNNRKFKNITTVINFDMVGRMDPNMKRLKCMSSLPNDSILATSDVDKYGLNLFVTEKEKLEQLDTKSFFDRGIPCLNFTTGVHDDYHRTSDDPKYISFDGMLLIFNYLIDLIQKI